jgi:hypothetical protein
VRQHTFGESRIPAITVRELPQPDAEMRNPGSVCMPGSVAITIDTDRNDPRRIGLGLRRVDQGLQKRSGARSEDNDACWVLTGGSQRTSPDVSFSRVARRSPTGPHERIVAHV